MTDPCFQLRDLKRLCEWRMCVALLPLIMLLLVVVAWDIAERLGECAQTALGRLGDWVNRRAPEPSTPNEFLDDSVDHADS